MSKPVHKNVYTSPPHGIYTVCGLDPTKNVAGTTVPRKVTCKHCLRKMSRKMRFVQPENDPACKWSNGFQPVHVPFRVFRVADLTSMRAFFGVGKRKTRTT